MKKILYLFIALVLFLAPVSVNAEVIGGRFYPTIKKSDISHPQQINNLIGHFDHKINVVFSDIDGTLIPFARKGERALVPESVKLTAQKLQKAGIPLFLVTGRSSWEAKQIAKRVGVENSYLIAQQGTQIMNPEGKIIYEDNISHKDSVKILKDIAKFEKDNKKKVNVFVYLKGDLYTIGNFDMPYIIQKISVLNSSKDIEKIDPKYALNKIGICSYDTKLLKSVQSYLKQKYPSYHIDISADCYCDITVGTATKGNAVKKLAEILKLDLKNAAVFGDAENDISMIELVKSKGGLSVAVGNAMTAVKSHAGYTTFAVTEDGFSKAIDKILENNELLH